MNPTVQCPTDENEGHFHAKVWQTKPNNPGNELHFMSIEKSRIFCKQCGIILPEANTANSHPMCPNCGSMDKEISVLVEDPVPILESIKTSETDITGFVIKQTLEREKIAGESRRKAKEFLEIDRSNSLETRKTHVVKELNEQGEFETRHNELIPSPAKHRPKK